MDVAFYEIFDEMITDLLKPDNLASARNYVHTFRCFILFHEYCSLEHMTTTTPRIFPKNRV